MAFLLGCHLLETLFAVFNLGMLSLSDSQLKILTTAAVEISPDKRGMFLERVAAMLNLRRRFDDADVADVVRLAQCGLVHHRVDVA